MAIKVGFSSMVCPDWNLAKIVEQATAAGYDGVELRSRGGEPALPELARNPAGAKQTLEAAGVALVCLACPTSFDSTSFNACAQQQTQLAETIMLAEKLGCPYVRIHLGKALGTEHTGTLTWVADELRQAADTAMRHSTTILVENAGDFVTSKNLWFVVDAVAHPAVRASWNPVAGRTLGEHPTLSIPRLAKQLSIFQVCDARFDTNDRLVGYELPGQGDIGLDRAIDLLKGVCFQGWLMFECPRPIASAPDPEQNLKTVAEYLRQRLAATDPQLSAYKGDKKAPNFKPPSCVESAPAT